MEQPPTKESRVPVNLRIKFRSETIEQFVERYAVDVSRGGIFIRTREPLAVGTQLKFDFQLQDTSPLMAGEGTVVWIREHDPTRAGVTPGMGVRFDKLTPASQPVLEKILADKGRTGSGPTATAPTATASGKSGAAALPVRRPSSTFSAVEPSLLGVPATGAAGGSAAGTPGSGPPAGTPGAAVPFGAAGAAAAPGGPSIKSTQPLSSPSLFKVPGAATPSSAPGAGAIPALESQSALGRLATGPNLSAFGPVGTAPRTKSPLPLPSKAATGDASGRITSTPGVPSVPTPLEDSERTQIADGLPEFSNEQPTHVGGPALGLNDRPHDLAHGLGTGHGATITATSRRTPTPPPEPKLSLDGGLTPGMVAPSAAAAPPATSAARTTSPDGTQGAAEPVGAGRLSANRPVVAVGPMAGPLDTDLASTVPASARVSAVKPVVQTNTPHATPRVEEKKRPTATFIVVGVLVGAAAAAGIALKMSNRADEAAAPTPATAAPTAQTAPPPATAPTPGAANPEATKTEPGTGTTVAANPTTAPKPGEAEGKAAEPAAPAAEAKPGAKPDEAKPAAEVKAEPEAAKPAAAAEPAKSARKPHPVAHKKGATSAEAASAEGADAMVGGDAANVARVISLPTGADVLIDGQLVGKTPFQGKDIDPAAPHALTVRKDGFETYEHMVSASDWMKGKGPGQSLRVTVKLRKAHGAGEPEGGGDKKSDRPTEPGATEPPKGETPPASETP